MKDESIELMHLVQELYEKNKDLSEDFTSIQLSQDKWSVKEIFGHLIDSAANNYQRFIRLQEETELSFPGYGTDWVKVVPYNSFPYSSLLTLWREWKADIGVSGKRLYQPFKTSYQTPRRETNRALLALCWSLKSR